MAWRVDGVALFHPMALRQLRSRALSSHSLRRLCGTTQGDTVRTTGHGHGKDGRWPGWQVVIGIEAHAQIKSRQKLFSQTWVPDPESTPNSCVSPYDAAFPGTLPNCHSAPIRDSTKINLRPETLFLLRSSRGISSHAALQSNSARRTRISFPEQCCRTYRTDTTRAGYWKINSRTISPALVN